MSAEKTQPQGLDTVAVLGFNSQGQCEIYNDLSVLDGLGRDKALFLHRCLELTWQTIQKHIPGDYAALIGRKISLRITAACPGPQS